MKIHLFATSACIVALLLTSIASCKKDDGGSNNTIVGEWEARSATIKITLNGGTPNTSTETYPAGHGAYAGIRSDSSYFFRDSVSAPNSETGIYTYVNNRFITKPAGTTESDTSTIVINGDQFTLSQTEQQGTFVADFTYIFVRQK